MLGKMGHPHITYPSLVYCEIIKTVAELIFFSSLSITSVLL